MKKVNKDKAQQDWEETSKFFNFYICLKVLCPEHWRLIDGSCWHTSGGEVASWQSAQDVCLETSSKAKLVRAPCCCQ